LRLKQGTTLEKAFLNFLFLSAYKYGFKAELKYPNIRNIMLSSPGVAYKHDMHSVMYMTVVTMLKMVCGIQQKKKAHATNKMFLVVLILFLRLLTEFRPTLDELEFSSGFKASPLVIPLAIL